MKVYDTIDITRLKPGDVVVTDKRETDLGSAFIRIGNFFKRGFKERGWTHAAVYAGDGQVIEALPHGVVERNFHDVYLSQQHNLRIVRYKNSSDEENQRVVDFCRSKKGFDFEHKKQYYFILNYLVMPSLRFALESRFFDRFFDNKESFFCSELAASGFQAADAYPFERSPRKIIPLDFCNPLIFELVGERVHSPDAEGPLTTLAHSLSYFLYLVAAFVFFAVDVSLAIVLFLFGHIILLIMLITTFLAALLEVLTLGWFKRKKKRI